ncbi:MAG TPA: hypothetical protein DCD99_01150 [Acinetobacter schindleri]|nr:hypothetical protein [Acinetobacter schindleri]
MRIKTKLSQNQNQNNITPNSVYEIKGSLKKQGMPTNGVVYLLSLRTMGLISTTKTNSNGSYEFKGLPKTSFIVVSRDRSGQFNAVIQDNVVPK